MPAAAPPDTPPPGGLGRRLGAIAYDAMALFSIYFFATLLLLPLHGGEAFQPHHPFYSAFLFALGCGFFGRFWTRGGQTLGMRAWRIKLVAADGGPVRWPRALLRCLVAIAGWACLGLGFWWAWFDPRRRTWHDLVSETYLVRI